jgi:hypothetical protein
MKPALTTRNSTRPVAASAGDVCISAIAPGTTAKVVSACTKRRRDLLAGGVVGRDLEAIYLFSLTEIDDNIRRFVPR